ncbi:acetyltransferase (GNAT) domain protein [Streptococcus sp. AS14]|uniref:GNAT family N-acetyltransferase n=1 Tax=Streptococcus sp. AS14 TaxID=936577 RepID=UPI0002780A85|nr:GNAT family N-acetyltransferase [Streptococcus sp. AS14]EJO18086.1 acetyltransferase (GNAT) domain protein [Streptococcus sp. AS14]
MIIRPASTKDCQAIYGLYQTEKWMSFTEEKVTSLFSTNLSHYVVVEENQKILGFARYLTDEVMTTFLAEIIIDKSYRGKGLGRQLIEEIHKKYPLTRIELISEVDGFYQTVGFKPVGTGFRKSE